MLRLKKAGKQQLKKQSASLDKLMSWLITLALLVMGPLEEKTVGEFNRVIAVNLTGQFIGVKTVAPYMRKVGGDSIINLSPVGGITGSSNGTVYIESKD